MSGHIGPSSIAELVEAIRDTPKMLAVGAGTKPRLATFDGVKLSVSKLTGILEYEPSEFTFTALAGTPLREIIAAMAERGQYLPFEPMCVDAGATLGGTVAAGLSGPGRFRYGGVRDFILGIRFVDGAGRLLRMGGKVVKNAAGFDLPKFFVGSLGRFGVLAEITFKVFPRPAAALTIKLQASSIEAATRILIEAANTRWELAALDVPPGGHDVYLRLEGPAPAVTALSREVLGRWPGEALSLDDAEQVWSNLREFRWAYPGSAGVLAGKDAGPPSAVSLRRTGAPRISPASTVPTAKSDGLLCKAALTPASVPPLAKALGSLEGARVHISAGGNVAYISLPNGAQAGVLDERLRELDLPAVTLRGVAPLFLGPKRESKIARAVKEALDPAHRFPSLDF
jgi:glycolate oxidase FAD binding subunit